MQIPGFAMTFYFLLAACVIGRSKVALLFFILMIALLGAYYWKNNQYKACKEWYRSKMLYNIGAYQAAKEGYEKLYPDLKTRGTFLFEHGHCLHKLKEYDNSTRLMQEAMKYTCDPMVLNIIGKKLSGNRRIRRGGREFDTVYSSTSGTDLSLLSFGETLCGIGISAA